MIALPLPDGVHLTRAFHLARSARERYGVDASLVDLRGRVLVLDPATAERLAGAMRRVDGERTAVSGAELLAAALLDEAVHVMLAHYRREVDPTWSRDLDAALHLALGHARLHEARTAFLEAFPPLPVVRGDVAVDGWLAGHVDGLPAAEVALEERIAVRLANENPALRPMRTLFDDRDLGSADRALAAALKAEARDAPGVPGVPGATSLWATLRAPLEAAPTSLEGQLAFVRTHWGARLGPAFAALVGRVDRALGTLRERSAGGPPGPPGPAPVPDAAALRGDAEIEAFSADADWMPGVVMVAKNAYVWLDQLARWRGLEVRTLADVPDAALAELRGHGFDALWLIGLWERSEASARIKRRRGQDDAVASAYALWDYRIAEDLGGEGAWRDLRDRAAAHGIRLAADMVPNHVGIDGRWVVEHPDRFLALDEPPFPGYAFTGPDLSGDPRVEVRLEDGYWDGSDAAVVFERTDVATGERRYVYHGNDGTSMPWNDTAQIDFLNPEAREAVVQVVLDVAKRFPIVRFDAAMTLAKRHVRRLWYPAPGEGGAVPTRSEHGTMDDAAFEAAMPTEFWREVVDRVAEEAPGTLLLAEAFWMMEGYFVRTLGMHRVYNSAFMNMLAREANADYQELVRNVLAFDAKVLARFVNFMNNPDEEPAIQQFGDGDKAFGVTALMATLPGLPMFGHGQVEGLSEKYGMEYRRAKWDERPNEALVERHRREIAPLLARRATFAGTDRFRWFEARGEGGPAPDVFAYANAAPGGAWAIVAYHNRYADVHVALRDVAPWTDAAGAPPHGGTLASALGLEGGHDRFVRWREHPSGLEYLAPADAWREGGLELQLGAYELRVLLDVQEVRDPDGSLRRLHDRLGGRGVPDLHAAARDLALAPLHRAWARMVAAPTPPTDAEIAAWVAAARDADPAAAKVLAAHPWASADVAPADGGAPAPAADAEAEAGDAPAAGSAGGADAVVPSDRPSAPAGAAADTQAETHADTQPGTQADVPTTAKGSGAYVDRAALEPAWARVPRDATQPGAAWRRAFALASAWPDAPAFVDAVDLPRAVGRLERGELDGGDEREEGAERNAVRDDAATSADAVESPDATSSPSGVATGSVAASSEAVLSEAVSVEGMSVEGASVEGTDAEGAEAKGVSGGVAPHDPAAGVEDADVSAAAWGAAWRRLVALGGAGPADPVVRFATDLRAAADDPTLRDAAFGVHVHDGVTWFRREGLRGWTAAWLAARGVLGDPPADAARVRAAVERAETASGYDWDALLAWAEAVRSGDAPFT